MARSARSSRSHQPEPTIATAQWVEDEDQIIEPAQSLEPVDPADALRGAGQWLSQQVEAAGELKATNGPRLGPAADRARRSGSDEEVVTPLLVRPLAAIAAARGGDVFERPLRRVQIRTDSVRSQGNWSSWLAIVKTGRFRTREATLRIGPSASGNLTVIQLVPQNSRRFRTRSFVNAGVPAIEELCGRLERDVE